MKKIKIITYTFLLILFNINAYAGTSAFVGPGSDSNCNFEKIQDAMDSGATTIFISTAMQYNENLILPSINETVLIYGGYTECMQSSFDSSLKSTVSGHLNDAPVLIISSSTERKTIRIRNMNLLLGTGGGFIPAGGINMVNSNDSLNLDNTTIGLNEGAIGGGIYIGVPVVTPVDFPTLSLTNKSLITNNRSSDATFGGGGVFCENGQIIMQGNSSIKRNTTEGSGGGIYAHGCKVLEWSSTESENDAEQGIYDNSAKMHGGGIYADNNSTIQLGTAGGTRDLYGSVVDNRADSDSDGVGDGGGIYLTGADASLLLLGSILKDNRTESHGGGIYAQNNSSVSLRRASNKCWRDYKCNYIVDNYASTNNGNGGGIYLANGALGNIESAYFEGNRADNGTAIYATNTGTNIRVANATFFANGNNGGEDFSDNHVITVIDHAGVSSFHNTFFNNGATISTIRAEEDADLRIVASILYAQGGSVAVSQLNADPASIECANTNDMTLTGTDISNFPITFVDESNGDLHLSSSDTGAIDLCPLGTIFTDIEGDERPYDKPDLLNLGGPIDAGADEFTDIIFNNGFEL